MRQGKPERGTTRWGGLFAGALLVALLAACAGNKAKPDQQQVRSLKIQGNSSVSDRAIKEKILTTTRFPLFFWEPLPVFDPTAWQADLRRVERFYQAQGFYQAEVVEDEVTPHPDKPHQVDLLIKVNEGKPTLISQVTVLGIEELPPDFQKKLLADLPLHKGDTFKEETWAGVKDELSGHLRELGYALAKVRGEVRVETTDESAHVVLRTEPGLRYKFGDIFIATGPHPEVKSKSVLGHAEEAIIKGRWYSDSALAEAQSRIFGMGVFGAVKVNRGPVNDVDGTVAVIVDVRESKFHTLKHGIGFGVDPVRNEFHYTAEYTDRDFFGGLRKLTLKAKAGYAFLPNVVDVVFNNRGTTERLQAGPIGDLFAEVQQPNLILPTLRASASVDLSRQIEQAYSYYSGRAKLGVVWQPQPSFSIFPSYNFELDQLQQAGSGIGATGAVPGLVIGCPSSSCLLRLSYLEEVVEWDRRDSRYEPRKGYYVSLSLQEGGGPLQGSFDYLRIQPDLRYYYSPTSRLTLAGRVRAGTLLTPAGEDSPIVSRFYSGGDSMRGFGTRRLSPMLALPTLIGPAARTSPADGVYGPGGTPRVAGQTVAVGGNGLFEASLEVRYLLFDSFILAAFVDMGLVTSCAFGEKSLGGFSGSENGAQCSKDSGYLGNNMQYAVGIGGRYSLGGIPLRVDIAYRLNAGPTLPVAQLPGNDVAYPRQGTCFGFFDKGQVISGSPEGPCSFNISVGEAF